MSFLKKTLASFGIGSAKVDSILNQDVLYPGQSVDVSIHVYGGATEQAIDNIDMKLCCRYIAEAPDDRGAREGTACVEYRKRMSWRNGISRTPLLFILVKSAPSTSNSTCLGTHQ